MAATKQYLALIDDLSLADILRYAQAHYNLSLCHAPTVEMAAVREPTDTVVPPSSGIRRVK